MQLRYTLSVQYRAHLGVTAMDFMAQFQRHGASADWLINLPHMLNLQTTLCDGDELCIGFIVFIAGNINTIKNAIDRLPLHDKWLPVKLTASQLDDFKERSAAHVDSLRVALRASK